MSLGDSEVKLNLPVRLADLGLCPHYTEKHELLKFEVLPQYSNLVLSMIFGGRV